MKNPEPLAGPHIEPTDVTLYIFPALGSASREVCGPDDHHILGDHRRRMQAHLAGHEVDILIVVLLEVDHATFAETWNGHAGFRVQRDQAVARRNVQDPLFLAIGPIGHPVPGKLPGCVGAAHALVLAMDP